MRTNDKIGGGFYFCNPFKNYINGWFKPGTFGGETPAARLSNLRHTHGNIEMTCYLPMPKATKAEYEAVEHHTKMMLLRRFPELTHKGNDHFAFKTTKETHKEQTVKYCAATMEIAMQYCDTYDIPYEEIIWPNFKKGGVRGKKKS